MLRNENDVGNLVYNRESYKLGTRKVLNPREKWVRAERCFKPMVDASIFQRVQHILGSRRVEISDGEILSRLRRALPKRGRLSQAIINDTSDLPAAETVGRHFGSLHKAYSLIGYSSVSGHRLYHESKEAWAEVTADFVQTPAARLLKLGRRIVVTPSKDHVWIDEKVGVRFA